MRHDERALEDSVRARHVVRPEGALDSVQLLQLLGADRLQRRRHVLRAVLLRELGVLLGPDLGDVLEAELLLDALLELRDGCVRSLELEVRAQGRELRVRVVLCSQLCLPRREQ